MTKGTVFDLKKIRFLTDYFKNNRCLLTLTVMFILGLSIGIFANKSNDGFDFLAKSFTESFLTVRQSGGYLKIFLNSFYISFFFLIFILIFGTSIVGVTIVPLLISLRGILFGVVAQSIYSQYSYKGIALNAAVLIPPTVISVIFLISAARHSMDFSLQVIRLTFPETRPLNLNLSFKGYCKRIFILSLPILFSAVLDAWISSKLIPFFEL